MSYFEDQNEMIHEMRRALKIYRSVNNYTLKALEKAISEIEDSLEHGMKIDTKKLYLDLLIKLLIIAALGVIALVSCGKIVERLDEQAVAEQQYIQAYQAELKAEQNKD